MPPVDRTAVEPSEYKYVETVSIGDRKGVVICRCSRRKGVKAKHTVLLGTNFAGDTNASTLQMNTESTMTLLSTSDDTGDVGLGEQSVYQDVNNAVSAFFVLNAQGRADALRANDAQDDTSEMFGTVPVACTCDDWKWRGVRHKLARGPGNRAVTKNRNLATFTREYRHTLNSRRYNTETDNDLAASQSGCRHMVWVSANWRAPALKRHVRSRRMPARYRQGP